MNAWQIALAVILPLIAIIGAITAYAYFVLLPKFLINKIRGGEENLVYPDNYEVLAEKVNIDCNLAYDSEYPNAFYDYYSPKDDSVKGLVLWIHGGFFIAGDKCGVKNVCTAIAAEGYCVAAINYAVAPENKYPTAVKQVNEFINHISLRFPELTANGIIVAGDSAGGHIAAQFALLNYSDKFKTDIGFAPLNQNNIKGLALVCAPIDVSELLGMHKAIDFLLPVFGRAYFGSGRWYKKRNYTTAHIYDYVDSSFPPCFITDGNRISFEDQNKKLSQLLLNRGVEVKEVFFEKDEYGDVNHEYLFDMTLDTSKIAMSKLIAFIDSAMNK